MSDERVGEWLETWTGVKFYPADPRPEEVCIEDIAHALSHQCRFGGAVREFYSVAQHSVLVSRAVPQADALWGLLHDASEAYLVDVPSPVKKMLPDYRVLEQKVMNAICTAFGLQLAKPASVTEADMALLLTERDALRNPPIEPWIGEDTPRRFDIYYTPWNPREAKALFLHRFESLFRRPPVARHARK